MMTHQSSDSAGLRRPVLLRCVQLTLYAGGPGAVLGSSHSCEGLKTPPARPPTEALVSTLPGPQPPRGGTSDDLSRKQRRPSGGPGL